MVSLFLMLLSSFPSPSLHLAAKTIPRLTWYSWMLSHLRCWSACFATEAPAAAPGRWEARAAVARAAASLEKKVSSLFCFLF